MAHKKVAKIIATAIIVNNLSSRECSFRQRSKFNREKQR